MEVLEEAAKAGKQAGKFDLHIVIGASFFGGY